MDWQQVPDHYHGQPYPRRGHRCQNHHVPADHPDEKEGYSILIISEEMPELIGMCDEILVMKDGKVTQSFKRSETLSEQQIIEYMI